MGNPSRERCGAGLAGLLFSHLWAPRSDSQDGKDVSEGAPQASFSGSLQQAAVPSREGPRRQAVK